MKMKLLGGAAAAALLAASAAQAAQPDGFYAAVDGGYHMELNGGIHTHTTANAPDGAPYGWKWSYDRDWAGFARVGYQVSPNWRVELEGGYRKGDMHSIVGSVNRAQPIGLCSAGVTRTAAAPACGSPGGNIDDFSGMGNVIWDILPNSKIDPFLGAGVGISYLEVKTFGQLSGVPAGAAPYQNLSVDHDDTAFAYQGLAGVAYHATDRLSIDLTYRYLRTADQKWTSTGSGGIQPGTFRGRYEDQTVSLGLRWNFGPEPVAAAPPPPPPPPPAAEPAAPPPPPAPPPAAPAIPDARQFVVYFPFDQSVLTTDAQSVVQAAANYAMQGQPTRIVVVGHTDTSGSFKYNLRLSERRAKTVADALVGLGVNQSVLAVDWKGKTDLAVATPDGVKEPLNRRSTIDINFQ